MPRLFFRRFLQRNIRPRLDFEKILRYGVTELKEIRRHLISALLAHNIYEYAKDKSRDKNSSGEIRYDDNKEVNIKSVPEP